MTVGYGGHGLAVADVEDGGDGLEVVQRGLPRRHLVHRAAHAPATSRRFFFKVDSLLVPLPVDNHCLKGLL